MTQWVMVVDVNKCIACYACFVACKDEFWDNDYLPYSVGAKRRDQNFIRLIKRERGRFPYVKVSYMPIMCMQCNDPPCIKNIKDKKVAYKRDDGIVIIDPLNSVGKKELLTACPYNMISWNDEKNLPQKCTFCVHRIEKGKPPRCVQVCPSNALVFGDLNDPESEVVKIIKSESAEPFHPEYGTKPNVYYVNLYKVISCFIAGNVVFKDTDECAEGVEVILINRKSGERRRALTDAFGLFDFDGLAPETEYDLIIKHPLYSQKELNVTVGKEDVYLGNIFLERRSST